MAWVELLNREDCKKKMVEACEKSKTTDYKNCAVYVNYNARNDYFYIDDFFDGGTITHFCNGERIL